MLLLFAFYWGAHRQECMSSTHQNGTDLTVQKQRPNGSAETRVAMKHVAGLTVQLRGPQWALEAVCQAGCI